MSSIIPLRNRFRQRLAGSESRRARFAATIGDGAGNAKTGERNYVYLRRLGRSRIEKVLNLKVPSWDELPVIAGYTAENPKELQVLEIDYGRLKDIGNLAMLPEHHESHELLNPKGGNDVTWISRGQMVPLLLSPTSPASMQLAVLKSFYPYGSAANYFPGAMTEDMRTRYPDVAQGRYVLVSVDGATNVLQYTNGDAFPSYPPPGEGDAIPDFPAGATISGAVYLQTGYNELLYDAGFITDSFETAGGGGADIFDHWTENAGDGAIADEGVIVYSDGGAHACKLTSGATSNTYVYQDYTVTAGEQFRFSFYTRGDGVNDGQYRIYDVTGAADIVAATRTNIPGATYTQFTGSFVAPSGCTSVRFYVYCPTVNGGIAYFDAVSIGEIDATLGWAQIRALNMMGQMGGTVIPGPGGTAGNILVDDGVNFESVTAHQDIEIAADGEITVTGLCSRPICCDMVPSAGDALVWLVDAAGCGTSDVSEFWGPSNIGAGGGGGPTTADQVTVDILAGATYDDVQDWIDVTQSAGRISGGGITDAYPLINVALGTGIIKSVDAHVDDPVFFDWPNVNGLNPALGHNWVYVDWNGGVPTVAVTSTWTDIDRHTQFTIAEIWDTGAAFHILPRGQNIYDGGSSRAHRNLEQMFGFRRGGDGLIVTESGAARTVDVSVGFMYRGLNQIPQAHIDTDPGGLGDTFTAFYRDGVGGWTEVPGESAISNSQWDDGDGGLANLGVGRYGVYWAYLDYDDHLYIQYGQGNYKLAQAEAAIVPETMPFLSSFALLIARVIVLQGAPTFYSVAFPWDEHFNFANVADHGNLDGLLDNDHTFLASIRYVTHIRGGVSTEYADPDDAFTAADTPDDVILVPPGTWTLDAAHSLTSVDVVGMGRESCVLQAVTDVGAILLELDDGQINDLTVSYDTDDAAARTALKLVDTTAISRAQAVRTICENDTGDAIGMWLDESHGTLCANDATCNDSANAIGTYIEGGVLEFSRSVAYNAVDGGARGIEVDTGETGIIQWCYGSGSAGAGIGYGIYLQAAATAWAHHCEAAGTDFDLGVLATATLNVYSCMYDTASVIGTLTQDEGDRAGLARDETVTGAWTFSDDITMGAGKLVDGVELGTHAHTGGAGMGVQLDWDTCWSDAVHNHSAAGEGGTLDWDTCWADAVHDHSAAGEGGQITRTAMAGQDTNVYFIFGRAYVGYDGAHDDYASFGHLDSRSVNGYAILVAPAGTTYINCAAGRDIYFRVNNATEMRMDEAGLQIDNGLWVGTTGTQPDDNDVHIDGSINKSTALGCRAISTAALTMVNGNLTALSFNSQIHDTDGGFAPTSTRLYAKHAGYYISGASVALEAPGSAIARKIALLIKQDGAQYLAENDVYCSLDVAAGTSVTTGMFYMAVNEYVEFYVYHDTGFNVDTFAASANNQHYCNGWLVRVA